MLRGSALRGFSSRLILVFVLAVIAAIFPLATTPAGHAARTADAIALYDFSEGSGTTIGDSGSGSALNLSIESPAAVSWIPGGGLSVTAPAEIVSTSAASKISAAVKATDEITVEAWVKPASAVLPSGIGFPRRIATMSDGTGERNFTLGQFATAYGGRFRSTESSLNGLPSLIGGTPNASALQHLVFTRDNSGVETIYVDGAAATTQTIGGDTSGWDDTYNLLLADEAGGTRAFLGDYCLVAIYDRALTPGEVTGNHTAGCSLGVDEPPVAPTDLVATAGDGVVNLAWTANSEGDIDGYNVYRSTSSPVSVVPGNKVNTALVAANAYADTSVTNGTPYYYVATAVDLAAQESGASNEDSATPAEEPPSAPTNLTATGGVGTVYLSWTANSEGDIDGYNVYRSTSSPVSVVPGNMVNTTLVATNAYSDTSAANGTEYWYVVTAVNTVPLESGPSNEDSATPTADASPPLAPTSLAATGGNSVVDLAWAANGESDLDGYNVYRSTSSPVSVVPGNMVNTTLVATNAYSDTSAVNGTEYWYVVTAVDFDGSESGASNEDSATPSDTGPAPLFGAYNDFAWKTGQTEGNITKITSPNGGSGLPSDGELVDFSTGTGTDINLTVTGGSFNGDSHADTQTGEPTSGTDAFNVFNGKLTALGSLSYEATPVVPPPDGNLVLTFDGLEPSHDYEFVFYAHRDNYTLDERASLVTISGALDFTNKSTTGSDFSGPDDDSTRMPPDNDLGWVSRWTNVHPGSDGIVVLTITYDGLPSAGDENQGKYANALALFDEGMVRTGETVRFAAMGDFGAVSSNNLAVSNLIDSKSVDLIITTGDNSYGGTRDEGSTVELAKNVGAYYGDYIGAPTGTDPNRFFPSIGNHDYTDGGGITGYKSYFNLPGAGIPTSASSNSPHWYDFVQGPVHFFAIDSNPTSVGGDDANRFSTGAQGQWLQAQLAASTAPWKIVYFHHPPYSSGSPHGTIEDTNYGLSGNGSMKWPFEEWGATAVMGGHDHLYERILKDENGDSVDLPYFVTGAGGKSLYGFDAITEPGSESLHSVYGSMIVNADDDNITFEFWSAAGALLDTYAIGTGPPPPEPPTDWVAYNDMNTLAGGSNPSNVTSYTYSTGGALKDYGTGAVLPVTVTGSWLNGVDPVANGGPVTNTASDAYAAFNGIVDLSGIDELDSATWDSTVTFDNLDPTKRYAITLTANRAELGYLDERFAMVTIGGVDASTNDSTSGVVENTPQSVSFSVGYNSEAGYVARWVDIDPGADGSFSVLSEWDDGPPGSKGYSMSAFKLETYTPPVPAPDNWTAYNDTAYVAGQLNDKITVFTSPNGSSPWPSAGELVDYATGGLTGATLTITGGSYNGGSQGSHGSSTTVGDANAIFDGIVNPLGTVSYTDASDGNLVFEFTDLDPARTYSIVHYANRGKVPPYAWDRAAYGTISDVDAFVNNSTVGTDNNGAPTFTDGDDPSTRYSADNSTGTDPADGWVVRFDDIEPGSDGDVTLTMSFAGEEGFEYKGKYSNAIMIQEFGDEPIPEPTEWMAYNDLNTSAGAANPVNVTDFTYANGGALTDYVTGLELPITVTGSYSGTYSPQSNGAPVSNVFSDAFGTFDGVVDLTGVHELGDATWDNTITFDNLDPTKKYAITLTANRDNATSYDGQRYAEVTIGGVDDSTNASSAGAVENSPTSVSFSVGYNGTSGNVAKWVDIDPGADGSFSVASMWDDGYPGSKGYAMSAFKIETYTPTPPPATPENWTAYNDTGYVSTQPRTNITGFTSPAGGAPLFSSGELIDYATGIGTGAMLAITGGSYNGGSQGGHGSSTTVGDANAVFNGIVDPLGTLSYESNDLVFAFTGLDPAKEYSLVHYANRAGTPPYGWNRGGLATISGVDGFINNSTIGEDNNGLPVFDSPADPSTRYSADNSIGTDPADGWVVRFDSIQPGGDGNFTLTMSWAGEAGSEDKGKYSNALMIAESDPGPALGLWTAYNDLAWGAGQAQSNITHVTSPTGPSGLPSSGELVDYSTGLGTGVTLAVTGGDFRPANATQGADATTGDAFTIFDGRVSTEGAISYVASETPTGDLVLTLTGMDPTHRYDVAFNGHRDGYTWAQRSSLVTITDAVGFTNVSSVGVDDLGAPLFAGSSDASTRLPPDNDAGYVARWMDVDPGSDGDVVLTLTWDGTDAASQFKGKYASALALSDQGLPDLELPVVVVDVPVPGAVVAASSLELSGSATDDVGGVTDVRVAVWHSVLMQWWGGTTWQDAYTTAPALLDAEGGLSTGWLYNFAPPSPSSQPYLFLVEANDATGRTSYGVSGWFTLTS